MAIDARIQMLAMKPTLGFGFGSCDIRESKRLRGAGSRYPLGGSMVADLLN
jgi:hypothetical protein